jgi:type VI secretion system protein ImpG
VTGFSRKTGRERTYAPFELFAFDKPADPVFHTDLKKSPAREGFDVHLSVAFPPEVSFPETETLSIGLTCTNGNLADNLRVGDICVPISAIPEQVTFSNITPVNPGVAPPLGNDLLWRLTCHLYLNHASLESAERLRTLLQLYIFENDSVGPVAANRKRISGIEEVSITPGECMVEGISMRGSEIRLKVRQDHFAGAGDLYLFGCVLDQFLAEYASINSFTRLVIDEILRGRSQQWPIRQQ